VEYSGELILLVAKIVYMLAFSEPNFRDSLHNLKSFKNGLLKLILQIGITKDKPGEIDYLMKKSPF